MTTTAAPTDPPHFTIRSTEDVIALVPLVLGFHPSDSVVLLTFGSPHGSFHARVDLPRTPGGVDEVVTLLSRAVRSNAATTAMLVVCADRVDHDLAVEVMEALLPALTRVGAEVVDAVRIDGTCWWPLTGVGEPQPYDVSAHPFTAQRVLDGEVVRESREAVVGSLACADEEAAALLGDRVEEAVAQHRDPRLEAAWLRDWLEQQATWPRDVPRPVVPDTDAARVLALVSAPEQREVACVDLTRERARHLAEVWSELVRRAPAAYVAGPAALLALTAWLAGDGALAWCAVDRAREAEPDAHLAHCVARALQTAVPPSSWRGLDASQCPLLVEAQLPDPGRPQPAKAS